MFDLENLSLKELQRLQKDVETAINGFKDREKRKALAEVEAFVRERGLSFSDLAGLGARGARKSVGVARYANPADASQTWTGRGRKPAWVIEALNSGKALEDLAI